MKHFECTFVREYTMDDIHNLKNKLEVTPHGMTNANEGAWIVGNPQHTITWQDSEFKGKVEFVLAIPYDTFVKGQEEEFLAYVKRNKMDNATLQVAQFMAERQAAAWGHRLVEE